MVDFKKCDVSETLKFKDEILNKISIYLDDISKTEQKQCALISYWLRDYYNYIKFEKSFNPSFLPVYKKGSIIEVNFGYRIGSEMGGRHYAVVLDNKNAKNSPIVTVVPLSSIKENKTHFRSTEVNLDTSIYNQLFDNFTNLLEEIEQHMAFIQWLKNNYHTFDDSEAVLPLIIAPMLKNIPQFSKIPTDTDIETFIKNFLTEVFNFKHHTEATIKRIENMKSGSYAIINQITTISKQRIFDPVKSYSSLNGIILPKPYMDKIEARIKSNFLKS